MSPKSENHQIILFSALTCLYFSQGLPSGLLAHALPTLMREYGVDLKWIGLIKLLALPWLLKFIWAPIIDHKWKRKGWIFLFQGMVIPLLLTISFMDPALLFNEYWLAFLVIVLLINLFSASQDVASDGLAVQALNDSQLGLANSIQVSAYKVGLIIGGSALLILKDELGWSLSFQLFALFLLLALIPVFKLPEKKNQPFEQPSANKLSFKQFLHCFTDFFKQGNMLLWIIIVSSFKMADEMGSSMLKPMLIDIGYTSGDVGKAISIASISGIIGACLCGYLYKLICTKRALLVFGFLQTLGILSFALIPITNNNFLTIQLIINIEQFVDGLSTVILFAAMMQHCREGNEGTDYTIQNSLHVIGIGMAGSLSGFIADAWGYNTLFLSATCIGLCSLIFVARLKTPGFEPNK